VGTGNRPHSCFPMIPLIAQLVNFALSLFFWLIIGRAVLGILSGGRSNFFTDLFRRGTDPVFALVRRITPEFIPDGSIPALSLLLLVVLRFALLPWLISGA
jgi:uncharacterized protein YggT (Ycf19 family)